MKQPPVIDGVLDDPAWKAAPIAGDFLQQDPDEGEPSTERTEFRVLYDDRALYIGVWCYDSEPNKIIARSMTRDDYPYEDDHLYIAIDSFLDYRNGYAFATNANGCRWDGLIINNSYTGGSWDTIWECKGPHHRRGVVQRNRHSVQLHFLQSQQDRVGIQHLPQHPTQKRDRPLA